MAMSKKEREGLELFKKHMEKVKRMSPEERAAHQAKVEALGDWLFPNGHAWHMEEDEEE